MCMCAQEILQTYDMWTRKSLNSSCAVCTLILVCDSLTVTPSVLSQMFTSARCWSYAECVVSNVHVGKALDEKLYMII